MERIEDILMTVRYINFHLMTIIVTFSDDDDADDDDDDDDERIDVSVA